MCPVDLSPEQEATQTPSWPWKDEMWGREGLIGSEQCEGIVTHPHNQPNPPDSFVAEMFCRMPNMLAA